MNFERQRLNQLLKATIQSNYTFITMIISLVFARIGRRGVK